MAIPLVGLSVQTPDIGNAFLTGVYNGEDRQAAQAKMQADAQKSQMEARAAKLGQLSNMAFAISRIQDPKQRAAALDRGKQAIASMYGNDPETMRALAGVTADNVEGYAMTLTSIADHLKAGKTDAEIANIYNTMGNRDANTSSMISDRQTRTGIYGSGVANANANRDAMTGLAYDKAARTGYGQVPEGQVLNPQTGRAEDIPGAYRKPLPAGAPGSGILRPRDYPTAVINAEETDTNEIRTAAQLQDDTSAWLQRLNSGQVNLGGPQNLFNSTLNVLGMGGEETADLQELTAFANRLVNESLRLNKGVQTEGDAIRASNEMLGNLRNPEVVKRQMQVLNDLNERVLSARLQGFKERRARYGLPEFDPSGIIPTRPSPYARGDQGGVPLPPELQGTPDGSSVEGPDGRRYVVQGGQLVPAQ